MNSRGWLPSPRWRQIDRLVCLHVVLAASIFSLHHWVAIAINHGAYTPFSASSSISSPTFDETQTYAPPARRFESFGRLQVESDNYELRDLHGAMPFAPVVILGGIGRLSGSLERAFIVSDALFPAALFLLFYCLSRHIVQSRVIRLFIAWSTMLIPFAPKRFFWQGYDRLLDPFEITRTPHPEISIVFLLLGVCALGWALRADAGWPELILAGIASGINVYTYYFYTVAWGIALVLLFVAALIWKNRRLAIRTMAIGSLTILLAVPFAVKTLRGTIEGGQGNFLAQVGQYTRKPHLPELLFGVIGFCILITLGAALFEHGLSEFRIGLLSLCVVAGLLGMNIQIVTGLAVSEGHFMLRLVQPVGFFLGSCALGRFLARRSSGRFRLHLERLVAIGIVFLLINATARQSVSGIRSAGYQRSDSAKIKLLTWVRSNLPAEQVIGTCEPEMILLIPAITANFTYVPSGLRSLTGISDISTRYFELASLLNYSEDDVARIARARAHWPDQKSELSAFLAIPEAEPASMVAEYRVYLSGKRELTGRLDYAVVSAEQPLPPDLKSRYPEARVVYENESYRLIACGPKLLRR